MMRQEATPARPVPSSGSARASGPRLPDHRVQVPCRAAENTETTSESANLHREVLDKMGFTVTKPYMSPRTDHSHQQNRPQLISTYFPTSQTRPDSPL
jgi:hypothetical protein